MKTLSLLGILGLASAADLYVSTEGSDQNDGSAQSPFLSLETALQTVEQLVSGGISEAVTVHLADGVYSLNAPLNFTGAHSGKSGQPVTWKADGGNAIITGGLRVTGWTEGENGVYSASVPKGTKSRNLYVNGKASNYARRKIANRKDFSYTSTGMTWTDPQYDWLQTTPGIVGGEVRFINSFTDRYNPIKSVGDRELVMAPDSWANNIWGWDTVVNPFADFGVWVQNVRALLTEGGEFYLDSDAGLIYYKPLDGEDMSTVETYLGILECLISVSGTYDNPAHDILFSGLNFAHTTWMFPSENGYVDQQTGGYIGNFTAYPEFEATRPHWWQMPSAIQISAAHNIAFTGGSYSQLGAGGVGIGNDDNAHISGVGLGAQNVSVTDAHFTQVMGNAVTGGGIQAEAHHPDSELKINKDILISNNVFTNNTALFSASVPIFVTYLQFSEISHNDISHTTYSGICHGYGWGANDAGGSPEYEKRGLYKYQPLYTTPTTSMNNLIEANLVNEYGYSHTDLGAFYTLSKSPSTLFHENYAFGATWAAIYTDEGSNSMTFLQNMFLSDQNWVAVNGVNTGNNTYTKNYYLTGSNYANNTQVQSVSNADALGQRVAYRAGVTPSKRAGRPTTNPSDLADGYLGMSCQNGILTLTLWNFDDLPLQNVKFSVTAEGASLSPKDVPNTVRGDTWAQATYDVSNGECPSFTSQAQYTNSRTGQEETREGVNATPPTGQ